MLLFLFREALKWRFLSIFVHYLPKIQSIVFILSQLEPDSRFDVRIENTILLGGGRTLHLQNSKTSGMKRLPNVISVLRVAGSIGLLFCDVAGWMFWALYALCGISDMVDGWLARRLHAESNTGAILDSVSDILFVACCAIRLSQPLLPCRRGILSERSKLFDFSLDSYPTACIIFAGE